MLMVEVVREARGEGLEVLRGMEEVTELEEKGKSFSIFRRDLMLRLLGFG
jgi:hypothetical protein